MSCIARKLFHFLPSFLRRWLDPFDAAVGDFLSAVADRLPAGRLLLDAGAGESRHELHFPHARYISADLRVGDSGWNYSGLDVVADLQRLPFRPGCMDAVICVVVLEHVIDPLKTLREFRRVLRDGASVNLVTPLLWEEHQKPHDYYRFTSDGLRELLLHAGFRTVEVRAIGGFFWVLGRRFINSLTLFQTGLRWPVFILLAPFCGFLLPLLCYILDPLDREQRFTLGHTTVASA